MKIGIDKFFLLILRKRFLLFFMEMYNSIIEGVLLKKVKFYLN